MSTGPIHIYYPLGHRPGRISAWAYCLALRPGRREEVDTLRADARLLLAYVSLRLGEESDRCEQNVNKRLLADSAVYFGLKSVIDA